MGDKKYPLTVFAYAILLDNKIETWHIGTTNRHFIGEFSGYWKIDRIKDYRLEKKCYICDNEEEYKKVFTDIAPKWFKTWNHAKDYTLLRAY